MKVIKPLLAVIVKVSQEPLLFARKTAMEYPDKNIFMF